MTRPYTPAIWGGGQINKSSLVKCDLKFDFQFDRLLAFVLFRALPPSVVECDCGREAREPEHGHPGYDGYVAGYDGEDTMVCGSGLRW